MDIRLLGPVEVVVDERVRSLPGAGERELLALLALSAGRVVAAPALVDGLWGEALPVNPGNALQVRMSRLRRALAAAGASGELVVTRSRGCLLALDRGGVDSLRFADQVAAARAAAAADPVAAAGLYREALGAGRGPGLARFAGSAGAGASTGRRWRRGGARRWPSSPARRGRGRKSPGWPSCSSSPGKSWSTWS